VLELNSSQLYWLKQHLGIFFDLEGCLDSGTRERLHPVQQQQQLAVRARAPTRRLRLQK
jgi:hypothetical protein